MGIGFTIRAKEISDLFEIVNRDLAAAQTKGLDSDWKFGIAYNAALKLCAIRGSTKNERHFRSRTKSINSFKAI